MIKKKIANSTMNVLLNDTWSFVQVWLIFLIDVNHPISEHLLVLLSFRLSYLIITNIFVYFYLFKRWVWHLILVAWCIFGINFSLRYLKIIIFHILIANIRLHGFLNNFLARFWLSMKWLQILKALQLLHLADSYFIIEV